MRNQCHPELFFLQHRLLPTYVSQMQIRGPLQSRKASVLSQKGIQRALRKLCGLWKAPDESKPTAEGCALFCQIHVPVVVLCPFEYLPGDEAHLAVKLQSVHVLQQPGTKALLQSVP